MKAVGEARVRKKIQLSGVVQGVGMRPFIYALTERLKLSGFCRNSAEGVLIEVECGGEQGIECFIEELKSGAPRLSRIESLSVEELTPLYTEGFTIESSSTEGSKAAVISADSAVCKRCIEEMSTPTDRRYHYPFINCTDCGPRYSIISGVPYDRANSTMSAFTMCVECEREYNDPTSRRFHCEPVCCADCGPRVWLSNADGTDICAEDPIKRAAELIKGGEVVAVKGLGGFHLVCDALNEEAVRGLRESKRGSAKPFAVMARDMEVVRELCVIRDGEASLLSSQTSPIVLLKKSPRSLVAESVAPGLDSLGVMLPYTPLHVLLTEDLKAVVATSANVSDEPIVKDNAEALTRLSFAADYFLLHDRDIFSRVDDSIEALRAGKRVSLRRARGRVPETIRIEGAEDALSVGAELKSTFTLSKGAAAITSQHLGDLKCLETEGFFRETLKRLSETFEVRPRIIALDMHPDYLSSSIANELKRGWALPDEALVKVQHHHAHVASVMAEHSLSGELIGVAFDGTGYGTDHCIWGGEFLVAAADGFERAGHLKYVPMPGGDKVVREPWRMAASHLIDSFGADNIPSKTAERFDPARLGVISEMIEKGINSPLTSSAGRLFDAAGAILSLSHFASYEAEAAIRLEAAANVACESGDLKEDTGWYPFEITAGPGEPFVVDTAPVIRALCKDSLDAGPQRCALKFHETMARVVLEGVERVSKSTGLERVALSGGVFQNRLLLEGSVRVLKERGFDVFINERVPPNDGGVSLGQLFVASRVASEDKAAQQGLSRREQSV